MDELIRLRGMGMTLTTEGGNVLAGPKAALTEEARSLIRAPETDRTPGIGRDETDFWISWS